MEDGTRTTPYSAFLTSCSPRIHCWTGKYDWWMTVWIC